MIGLDSQALLIDEESRKPIIQEDTTNLKKSFKASIGQTDENGDYHIDHYIMDLFVHFDKK